MTAPARLVDHWYILSTIALGIYGQIVVKWQLDRAGPLPEALDGKLGYLAHLFLNPWVISGFAGAVVAAMTWLIALKKFEMTYAYPFISLTFPGILICGALLFGEQLTWSKVIGTVLIILGIVVHARA